MLDMPMHWDIDDFRDPGARLYILDQEEKGGVEARENARIGNIRFGRDNCRLPVHWDSSPNAGFSTVNEGGTWIGLNENYKDGINVEDQQKDEDSIWHFWRSQLKLRKEHKELFMHGAFKIVDFSNEKTFTYVKTSAAGDEALVCMNFSNQEVPLSMPIAVPQDIRPVFLAGNMGQPSHTDLPLKAWEGRVYLLELGAFYRNEPRLIRFPNVAQLDASVPESWRK